MSTKVQVQRIILRAHFRSSLIRLVDKALEDYELSRVAFSEYVSRPSNNVWSPLFRAVGYMENCFGSLERALRLARRLAEHQETASAVSGFSVLKPAVRKRISNIRNAMEHIDDRVIRQQIKQGDLTMLFLSEDAVELQHERIEYSELATWLRELHDLSTNGHIRGVVVQCGRRIHSSQRSGSLLV